jgi:plasmid stabilization system protein ParE
VIAYRFHPEAAEEFEETAAFYEARVTGLGASFVREVDRTIGAVRRHPDSGTPLGNRVRSAPIQGFPYSVIYRRVADHLLILALSHHRRRPGYWRNRSVAR